MKLLWIIFSISFAYQGVQALQRPCRNPNNPSVYYYKVNKQLNTACTRHETRPAPARETEEMDVEQFKDTFKKFMDDFRDVIPSEYESHEEEAMDSMDNFRKSFEDFMEEFGSQVPSEWNSQNVDYDDFRQKFEEFMHPFRNRVLYGNNECVTFKQWTSSAAPPTNTFII